MDDEKTRIPDEAKTNYPFWFSAVIVLLWLLGFGVFLVFGFFALIALADASSGIGSWNLLVTLAEGWVLFLAARHFFSGGQPMSTLFFWVAIAAVGIPLVAVGGCSFMADSFRLAG